MQGGQVLGLSIYSSFNSWRSKLSSISDLSNLVCGPCVSASLYKYKSILRQSHASPTEGSVLTSIVSLARRRKVRLTCLRVLLTVLVTHSTSSWQYFCGFSGGVGGRNNLSLLDWFISLHCFSGGTICRLKKAKKNKKKHRLPRTCSSITLCGWVTSTLKKRGKKRKKKGGQFNIAPLLDELHNSAPPPPKKKGEKKKRACVTVLRISYECISVFLHWPLHPAPVSGWKCWVPEVGV